MYIKRYSVAAFLLMGLVGWYIYAYITQEVMSIDLFGIPIPAFSIAVLVVVPIFVLYIASVLHMSFYNMLANLRLRKTEKDYTKLFDSIVDAYLGKINRQHKLKTEPFMLLGDLLDNSTVSPVGHIDLDSNDERAKKIKTTLKAIDKIKNGEVVDMKAYNLLPENELIVQNNRNMYKKGDLTAEEILSKPAKYTDTLRKEVFVDYVKTATVVNIDKYKEFITKDAIFSIISRINAKENILDISNEALIVLISNVKLTSQDFINISKATASYMIPEQRIKLFETMSADNEDTVDAYLYTLLDLEMLEPAYALLDISQPDEYQNFKAYRVLKEAHQPFSIELFI